MPLPDFLPGQFALARGRASDYFALERFHYLPRRPATYADVWVVRYADGVDPVNGIGVDRGDDTAPLAALRDRALRFADLDPRESDWRLAQRREADDPDRSRIVAVGVLSFPTFRSTPRERVLRLRDLSHRERTRFCNAHLRTISRVVVHPQFRSLGLASEIVRALIGACPTRYVEASAVMARVHPFFACAGMQRIESGDEREPDDGPKPAYFIFDKEEGSSCAS